MQELRFIGSDDEEALILSDEAGQRYRIIVDDALREALRPRPAHRSEAPRVPPREIQQLIRAGHTVDDVVRMTGADREDVERFEGPVRAEREYIVAQARQVPVRVVPGDGEGSEPGSFGEVLDERLEGLDASDITWDAWKDPEHGWRVSLEFRAGEIARDAMWSFEPRAHVLSPLNASATALSQLHDPALTHAAPRLRAVAPPVEEPKPAEESPDEPGDEAAAPAAAAAPAVPQPNWLGAAVTEISAAGNRGRRDETADLLEALRRRRGERDANRYEELPDEDFDESFEEGGPHTRPIGSLPRITSVPAAEEAEGDDVRVRKARDAHPSTGALRLRPAPELVEPAGHDDAEGAHEAREAEQAAGEHDDGPAGGAEAAWRQGDAPRSPQRPGSAPRGGAGAQRAPRKGGRPAMPSWDEIVFGTRPDDER